MKNILYLIVDTSWSFPIVYDQGRTTTRPSTPTVSLSCPCDTILGKDFVITTIKMCFVAGEDSSGVKVTCGRSPKFSHFSVEQDDQCCEYL